MEVGGAQVRTSLSEQEECVCVCVCGEGDFRRKIGSRRGTGQNVTERARRMCVCVCVWRGRFQKEGWK